MNQTCKVHSTKAPDERQFCGSWPYHPLFKTKLSLDVLFVADFSGLRLIFSFLTDVWVRALLGHKFRDSSASITGRP